MVDNAQAWLSSTYPDKANVTEIDSKGQALEGDLELKSFPKLEIVKLSGSGEITKITIDECPEVYCLSVNNNKISEIIMPNGLAKLQRLEVSGNLMTNLDFITQLPNLLILTCLKNPIKDEKINGSVLGRLVHYGGGIGLPEPWKPILYSVSQDYTKRIREIAKNLGIKDSELEGKTVGEIEKIVNDKANEVKNEDETNKGGLGKIEEKLPGLVSGGVVNETELDKIKDKVDIADKLGKLNLTIEQVEDLQKQNLLLKDLLEKFVGVPQQTSQIEIPPKT